MKKNIKFNNIKKIYNHILFNVKEEFFNITYFCERTHIVVPMNEIFSPLHLDIYKRCIVGHSVCLDWENVVLNYTEIIPNNYSKENIYEIDYYHWIKEFTGINDKQIFNFLFSSDWRFLPSKKDALAKLKMLIEGKYSDCQRAFGKYREEFIKKGSRNFEIPKEYYKEEPYII